MSAIPETICGFGVVDLISSSCFKTGALGRIQITNLPKCLKIFRCILEYLTNFPKHSTRKELINKQRINIVYGRRMVIEKKQEVHHGQKHV